MLRYSFAWAVLVVAAGCGGGGGGDAEHAGEVAAEYQGPIRSSDTARGEELYNGICMSCHSGGAPALDDIGWEPGALRQQVRQGEGRMPAISESRLSADDLEAILAYMVTIGAAHGDAAAPATTGDEAPADDAAGDLGEDAATDDASGESAAE